MSSTKRTYLIAGLLLLVFLVIPQLSEAQCAMCREVVKGGRDDAGFTIGNGINKGILYLMGVPYICLFILFRTRIISFFKEYKAMYQ